ncbi:MAG: hypothetical protein ACLR8Y_21290 [Alistipes indistinctus]
MDRETGQTSYALVKELRNGFSARSSGRSGPVVRHEPQGHLRPHRRR